MTCNIETRNICATVVCILTIILSVYGDRNGDPNLRPKRIKYNYFVRCTRRFTPGLCIEPVTPVWTFVFQLQNCTERYGCPQDWRTNRFSTHARCMRRCQPLVDLYTEALAIDPHNLTAQSDKSGRRNLDDEEDTTDLQEEDYGPRVEEHIHGPAPSVDDDPVDPNDWAVTQDVDDVNVDGLIDDDYFHH